MNQLDLGLAGTNSGFVRRWCQQGAIDALFEFFYEHGAEHNRNPLVAIPTGGGKSRVIGDFIHEVFTRWPKQRVMVLAHVKELIEQNTKALLNAWPGAPVGIYSSSLKFADTHNPIIYGGCASVVNNVEAFGHRDLLLIDEAHRVSPEDAGVYALIIERLRKINPYLRLIGFTATPFRMGGGLLVNGPFFTDMAYDCTDAASFNKMIADGYLKPVIPHRTRVTIDTMGVRVTGGDFAPGALEAKVLSDQKTWPALQELAAHTGDRKSGMIFATGLKHCDEIAHCLEVLGESYVVVTSKLKPSERDTRISAFKTGAVKWFIAKDIGSVGFDHPHIDVIAILRPTKSPVFWIQALGRGTRVTPFAANCLVFDFTFNTRELGPINDPKIPGVKKSTVGNMPVCFCPQCELMNHAAATICAFCGAEIPKDRDGKLSTTASEMLLLRDSTPDIHWYGVDKMVIVPHVKNDFKMLRVTFITRGGPSANTFINLERTGYPGKQARDWWKLFTNNLHADTPLTTGEALGRLNELKTPGWVKIWSNKNYPEIMEYSFQNERPTQ